MNGTGARTETGRGSPGAFHHRGSERPSCRSIDGLDNHINGISELLSRVSDVKAQKIPVWCTSMSSEDVGEPLVASGVRTRGLTGSPCRSRGRLRRSWGSVVCWEVIQIGRMTQRVVTRRAANRWLKQAPGQLDAVRGKPVVWHFVSEEVADAAGQMFEDNLVDVTVEYTPVKS